MMSVLILIVLLLTLLYIYTLYKQIIKIDKKRSLLVINFIMILLTCFVEYDLLEKREINTKMILIYLVVNLLYLLVFLRTSNKNETLTNQSIKEAIDKSNSGILVLKNKNKIKIQNSVMSELLHQLNIKSNYISELKKRGKITAVGEYTILIDEKAWLFMISEEDLEIIAIDIDEEYRLYKKIEEQNREIEENNKDIIWTIENMEYIQREKESQELKSKYHDLLGQSFFMLQQYLNQENLENKNIEDIKFMIREMFIDIEDTEEPEINLKDLIKVHKNTGTNIELLGKLPKNEKIAKAFFDVIREAVTNAIRHADSKKVRVYIKEELEKTEMIITNDGKPPKGTIVEHQGIKGMRRRIEKINGKLFITTIPEFKISIVI